jgi:glycerol-3-phosphate dehydrogenase
MRPRDVTRLESTPYDLLVVGGGIHGLASAYDAASRGLRVALIEAADFGSGASFNHQKTAHGGLRSLSTGNLGRASQMIRERRALARIAPWFLRPLPFIVGTYRSVVRNRLALRAAFKLDGWLGRRRNEGVDDQLHLPAPKLLSKSQTLKFFPGIRQEGLTGGAQWYDYQMVEGDRLTLAFAAAADRAGADLANHAEAVSALKDGGRIAGMMVRDRLTDRTFPIRAKVTLNAAGAHGGVVMGMFGVIRPFPLLKAMNLVTSKPAGDIALAAPSPAGHMLTLVQWNGRAIVGTAQAERLSDTLDTAVSAAEVAAFATEANAAFPALGLTPADVTLVHRGLLPAVAGKNGKPEFLATPSILDHASEGAEGAITVVGVKYTTGRAVAERAVNAVVRRLGSRVPPSRTASMVLPGAGIADHEGLAIETARALRFDIPLATLTRLSSRYSEAAADIVRLMVERDDLRAQVTSGATTVGAEIVHVIRHEMALRLADMVIRRTGLGAWGHPGQEALAGAARIAAGELRWTPEQEANEVAAVERFYAIETRES